MSEESAWAKVDELQERLDRLREFVNGFEARGNGLPLSTTDQLWIMSISKILAGQSSVEPSTGES